jgi:hypothetical protein
LVGLIALFALKALSAEKFCVIPVDAQKFWENFYFRPRLGGGGRGHFFLAAVSALSVFFYFSKKILKNFYKILILIFLLIFAFFSIYLSNQFYNNFWKYL